MKTENVEKGVSYYDGNKDKVLLNEVNLKDEKEDHKNYEHIPETCLICNSKSLKI